MLGDKVVYGLGTGNLVEDLSAEAEEGVPPETRPAGAVVCVEAATGAVVWRYDTPKSVHTALAADARSVYAACQDGSVYALDRATGKLRWRRSLGSALTAGPAVATYAGGALTLAVYAVSREGLVGVPAPGRRGGLLDPRPAGADRAGGAGDLDAGGAVARRRGAAGPATSGRC